MEWISVKDKLPDEQSYAWCKFCSGLVMACRMLQGELCWYDFENDRFYPIENWKSCVCGVNLWIPLPSSKDY